MTDDSGRRWEDQGRSSPWEDVDDTQRDDDAARYDRERWGTSSSDDWADGEDRGADPSEEWESDAGGRREQPYERQDEGADARDDAFQRTETFQERERAFDEADDRWTDPGESSERDRRRRERGTATATQDLSEATGNEADDELRSFVESDALPSAERMAEAELEAEREAARDAAEAAALESAPAGSRAGTRRSVDARLARLHLKGGLIPLARAELETMAGQVTLDVEALADLAEARWRSGDLLGAGEAAQAHLSRGGEDLIAIVVAVEALTAQGRTIDARRLAAQVVERTNGDLDGLFAGQPRAQLWSRPLDSRGEQEAPPDVGRAAEEPPAVVPLPAPSRPIEPELGARERERDRRAPEPEPERQRERSAWMEEQTAAWPAAAPTFASRTVDGSEEGEVEPGLAPDAATSAEIGVPGAGLEASAPAATESIPASVGEPPVEEPVEWPSQDLDRGPAQGREAAASRGARAGPPGRVVGAGARRLPSVAARRELREIEATLDEGAVEPIAGRLALLLRTEPDAASRIVDLAEEALELAPPGVDTANLNIVLGDALRVLGRSDEADLAYQESRRALGRDEGAAAQSRVEPSATPEADEEGNRSSVLEAPPAEPVLERPESGLPEASLASEVDAEGEGDLAGPQAGEAEAAGPEGDYAAEGLEVAEDIEATQDVAAGDLEATEDVSADDATAETEESALEERSPGIEQTPEGASEPEAEPDAAPDESGDRDQ